MNILKSTYPIQQVKVKFAGKVYTGDVLNLDIPVPNAENLKINVYVKNNAHMHGSIGINLDITKTYNYRVATAKMFGYKACYPVKLTGYDLVICLEKINA